MRHIVQTHNPTGERGDSMEPLFEARYHSTQKMLAEFARKYSTGPKWPLVIVFWMMYGFIMLPILLGGIQETKIIVTVVVSGLIMLMVSFMPQWYAWNVIRHTKKQNDGVLPETVVTFGDIIEMDEGMVHLTIEYRKIVKVIRLKHSYMLMIGKRNGVMLDPNSFTKGSFEEFKQFLRGKCPGLHIPE